MEYKYKNEGFALLTALENPGLDMDPFEVKGYLYERKD